MLNTYDHIVQVTIKFLELLKVRVTRNTINETLNNHPDFPSLLCIADAFNKWNIPNVATKMESKLNLDELPLPFLACTNKHDTPFAVVQNIEKHSVHLFYTGTSKAKVVSRDEFIDLWTGVCLFAEPNEESGEKEYDTSRRKAFYKKLVPAFLIIILTGLSFYFIRQNIVTTGIVPHLHIYLQAIIFLFGVATGCLLLWYEIDKNNPLLNRVCTGISKGNCNAILTGKASKLFSWLSWSEVGFFYFTGGLLCLMFQPYNPVPYILNLLALPYILFSIYYQWQVAKQWCILCLAVQLLLLLGGLNILVSGLYQNFSGTTLLYIAVAAMFYFLPVLAWYSMKPFVLKQQENIQLKREYLRIKFNTEIFATLLKKQKSFAAPVNGLGIDIGNPAATHLLVKVCNPFCNPCAKAHPKIEKLVSENESIKTKIIFATPNKPGTIAFKVAAHLLVIASSGNQDQTKQALDDWYLHSGNDYDQFARKYPLNWHHLADMGERIDAMDKWCKQTEIRFTPTIFLNGFQLPEAYGVEDLEYFLQQ
jgi:hypothetical protein